jgi:hypothetical protein
MGKPSSHANCSRCNQSELRGIDSFPVKKGQLDFDLIIIEKAFRRKTN